MRDAHMAYVREERASRAGYARELESAADRLVAVEVLLDGGAVDRDEVEPREVLLRAAEVGGIESARRTCRDEQTRRRELVKVLGVERREREAREIERNSEGHRAQVEFLA